ncbi:MAG TPA: DUF748 domain-containing protein, partial [Usitatibacter sp.]|nr:DUF748 domain-containing protein [Usitatibacter sp.]
MAASVPSTPAAWHLRPGALALSIPPAWQRRLRIALLSVAFLVALFAGLGFLAVPWIAKRQIESLAASELGRQATVGEVRFNPFTLRGRIGDFTLADREPGRTLLAFDSLDLDLAWDSIAKAALMVEAARLAGPRLRISLDAAGKSNVADIVERAMAPRQGGGGLPFAVHNIEVEGGTVLFEDARRGHKTEVRRLAFGVPFLSSRPSDTTVRVKPHLSGTLDGAAFAFEGTTSSPFDDIQRASLSLDLDALALPRYVEYAPLPNGLKLTDGALTTRLTLSFLTWKGQARGLELAGTASLDRLAIARPDGSPLVAVKRVEAQLQKLDALGRSVSLDRVAVAGPEVDLRRREDGSLELPALFASPVTPASAAPPKDDAAQPWSWSVREASLSDGRVRFTDASVAPPYATTLSGFAIAAAKVASRGEPGTIEASFQAEDGARFAGHANVDVAGQGARGRFEVQRVAIAPLHAYYDTSLAIDVRRGAVSLAGDFDAPPGAPGKFTLAGASVVVEDLDAALRGEREPVVRLSRLEAKDIAIELAARRVAVGSIAANQGALRLLREAGGRMSFERALPAAEPYRVGVGARAVAEAQWAAVVNDVVIDGLAADFEDRAVQPPVKVQLAQARLAARNLDTAPGTKANVDLAARVGSKGRIALKGTVGLQPLAVQADVQAAGIDLVAFQPYAPPGTNVIVTSGTLDARGRVAYDSGASGPNVRYAGDLAVNGFGSLDQPGSQELMRWKSLAATGIDLATAPFHVAASAVTLDRFYARLILDADAKLNVLQLLKPQPAADAQPAPSAATPAPSPATPAPAADIPASIARVQLSNGEVEFSDFFIRPNYSVHLTDLEGRLDGLAASQAGTVQVTARVDGAAPVDIRGTVNPFAKPLKLDIDAKATGADLSPLTPYAVKYAGYGIEKGKLSMEVHYTVDARKLSATNRITLDQLTFGDHVESPTATKLPVL